MTESRVPQVEDMFLREDREITPQEIRVFDSVYTILPGVFSPKVRNNSLWYVEKVLSMLTGSSFLEIGGGTGILAIEVAKRGYSVVVTDIDPRAVENIALNSSNQKVDLDVRTGNVFEPLREGERFDTIFWNHPWIYSEEKVELRRRVTFDYRYQALVAFLNGGKNHLTAEGRILLGTGSLARIDLITRWAVDAGYEVELACNEHHPLAVGGDSEAQFLIYSLRAAAKSGFK